MQPSGMLLAALVLTATTLAGCSGGPASDFVTPEQDEEGRYVIKMTSGLRFIPANAEVPAGSTVVWVHEGGGLHDTEAEDGSWKSGLLDQGEEYEITLDATGSYTYWCNPHRASGMSGVLRVV